MSRPPNAHREAWWGRPLACAGRPARLPQTVFNRNMTNENSEIELFLKDWSGEFSRAIEMFTGEKAVVKCEPLAGTSADGANDLSSHLWWKQAMERAGEFAFWIGAPESAWAELGGAVDGSNSEPQKSYLEIVGQANQAVLEALNRRSSKPFSASPGLVDALPSMGTVITATLSVTFREKSLSLIAAISPEADKVLGGGSALPVRVGEQSYAPMLQRLMDLELPLSITLGRAVLPVREVLKMTSGSMIELDRNVGEYVDLVVHGTVVARGEVVSVKGNYGVRIKEIISRQDRIALHNGA